VSQCLYFAEVFGYTKIGIAVLARWMRKFYAKQGKGSKADSPENPNWESWQEAAQQERAEAKVGATVAAGTIVPIGGVG
jgi:hypothetical protein